MQSGRDQLQAWRKRSKLQQQELARILQITDAYLSQVLSGKRRPSLPIAYRISVHTGVPMESWLDTRVGRTKSARKQAADKVLVSQ